MEHNCDELLKSAISPSPERLPKESIMQMILTYNFDGFIANPNKLMTPTRQNVFLLIDSEKIFWRLGDCGHILMRGRS